MRNQHDDRTSLPSPTASKRQRAVAAALALPLAAAGLGGGATTPAGAADDATTLVELGEYRTLDGWGNNIDDPSLGQAGQIYPRVADARYADGVGELVDGPAARHLSNRIFNDVNQRTCSW